MKKERKRLGKKKGIMKKVYDKRKKIGMMRKE